MAGYSAAALNAAVGATAALGTWISAHTADPGTTGANEVTGGTYARVQTTWGSPSGGASTGSQTSINIPASTTVTYFGVWSTQSGGTWVTGGALSASETFASAGVLAVTPTQTGITNP